MPEIPPLKCLGFECLELGESLCPEMGDGSSQLNCSPAAPEGSGCGADVAWRLRGVQADPGPEWTVLELVGGKEPHPGTLRGTEVLPPGIHQSPGREESATRALWHPHRSPLSCMLGAALPAFPARSEHGDSVLRFVVLLGLMMCHF